MKNRMKKTRQNEPGNDDRRGKLPEHIRIIKEGNRQTSTPALDIFRNYRKLVKWCTPSVLEEVMESYNPYSEGSISIRATGKLQDNSGVYAETHSLAAEAYKNVDGHSHYGCEGTTGANRVLFDLISRIFLDEGGRKRVLSARNVHQSVVVSARDKQVPVDYVMTRFDKERGLFLPPTADDVLSEINNDTRVVLLSNPTYEGFSCDLRTIIERIKRKNDRILIYIDEAWGAHFPFNDRLLISAIEAGADFVVQSLHKQGGAPNSANITHLSKRVKDAYLKEYLKSYAENTSTTYSVPLVAAMDLTRKIMYSEGKDRLDYMMAYADMFRDAVRHMKGIDIIDPTKFPSVHSYDPTKVNLYMTDSRLKGDDIAERLEKHFRVVTEKEERRSLCFLTTFSIGLRETEFTINALEETLDVSPRDFMDEKEPLNLPQRVEKRYETFEAQTMDKEQVPLDKSNGRVSGENIKCYPPGIYIVQMGEVINSQLIGYLLSQRCRDHFYAEDKSLRYITVLKER
ncbi:hypothetical protein COV19_05265 [Candidatus Woesearchaeota archaeon CG10_big_fil_rev_8_21_14_0_10_44_13]|nr:MAG: hypothetical protein COV19_05265 [Candidatus Woesearchaeota archaeon CG10_big_fil_rev_8_21_14_0_10_44_13]